MTDLSRLEQKFEDWFEKLYKLLGLPFERNEFLNVDFSANSNSYRSENSSNTTTKSESKQNWNSSSYALVNDQFIEGQEGPIQQTPFAKEGKNEVKFNNSPCVRSNASESNTYEEIKHDSLLDEGIVQNNGEKYIREDLELNNITARSEIPHSNTSTTTVRSESYGNFTKTPKIIFPSFDGAKPRLWVEKCKNYFQINPMSEGQMILMASSHFEGRAEIWYEGYAKNEIPVVWREFEMFNPTAYTQVVSLAKLQENCTDANTKRAKPIPKIHNHNQPSYLTCEKPSNIIIFPHNPRYKHTPVTTLPASSTSTIKRFPYVELREGRDRGHHKWKEKQLFMLVGEVEQHQEYSIVIELLDEGDGVENSVHRTLITIRIQVLGKKYPVTILTYSGNTHNFVDLEVVLLSGTFTEPTGNWVVAVANGNTLVNNVKCPKLKRVMQGMKFKVESALENLKQYTITSPVLTLPEFLQTSILEIVASNSGVKAVPIQNDMSLCLFSEAHGPKLAGLSSYENELLAVVDFLLRMLEELPRLTSVTVLKKPWLQEVYARGPKSLSDMVSYTVTLDMLKTGSIEFVAELPNFVKDFAICISSFVEGAAELAMINLYPSWEVARSLFDKRSRRSSLLRNATAIGFSEAAAHRRWEHNYMEENGTSYDMVIGATLEGVVLRINT